MPVDGDYEPSTQAWVGDQVEAYESSGGTQGTTLRDTGLPVVIITNRGASSGKVRKTPVMRVEHDGSYAAVRGVPAADHAQDPGVRPRARLTGPTAGRRCTKGLVLCGPSVHRCGDGRDVGTVYSPLRRVAAVSARAKAGFAPSPLIRSGSGPPWRRPTAERCQR